MNFGGPVWHVSVARYGVPVTKDKLMRIALQELAEVGDAPLGEWQEWTGRAYHIRRRLTEEEQKSIGPAVDVRGTPEGFDRATTMMVLIPTMADYIRAEISDLL